MKTKIQILTGIILAVFFIFKNEDVLAQKIKGNMEVVSQKRIVDEFTGIEAGSFFDIYLTMKDEQSVLVETDSNLQEEVKTLVTDNILKIKASNLKNTSKVKVYIAVPEINYINLSNAARVEGTNKIEASALEIIATGASQIKLDINVSELILNVSGASDVKLTGNAGNSEITTSGAANLVAKALKTNTANIKTSGASNVIIFVNENANTSASGASDIKILGEPKIEIKDNDEGTSRAKIFAVEEDEDYTRITAAGIDIEVVDGDSTMVKVGNKSLVVDKKGNVKYTGDKKSKKKFNGHWAGLDIGINGFVDKDFNTGKPKGYEFLNLNYEKSIDFSINFFEQNFNLIKNKFGIVTGAGLRVSNFRFEDQRLILVNDSARIFGFSDPLVKWQKSKVVNNYLTVPIMLEYQTNPNSNRNSFHLSAGMIFGWKYRTYTKMMEKENGRNVVKNRETFHMSPFRYDLSGRIGWGVLNLYVTYSLNTLFKKDEGPKLYPFAIGITITGW